MKKYNEENKMIVQLFSGKHHAGYPLKERVASSLKTARKIAAEMLGSQSLRGAATWDRYQGGTVYQFGPRDPHSGYNFVVINEDSQD